MTPVIYPLLLVGTADDGPTNQIFLTGWRDVFPTVTLFGETKRLSGTLDCQQTAWTAPSGLWGDDIQFVIAESGSYRGIPLYNVRTSGSSASFLSPPIVSPQSGDWLYRTPPPATDLAFAARCLRSQSEVTPPYTDTVGFLRVTGAGAAQSALTLGPLQIDALFPGDRYNDWKFSVSGDYLVIIPPPGQYQTSPLIYLLGPNTFFPLDTQTGADYFLNPTDPALVGLIGDPALDPFSPGPGVDVTVGNGIGFSSTDPSMMTTAGDPALDPFAPPALPVYPQLPYTLGALLERMRWDRDYDAFPFAVHLIAGYSEALSSGILRSYEGTYSPAGGENGLTPTAQDYFNALESVEIESFEVIAFPGILGRDLFPFAGDLFENHPGFPFRLVCAASASTILGAKPDLWQHDRLSVVAGKGIQGWQYQTTSDLVTAYSCILVSEASNWGLGTREPLLLILTEDATSGDPEGLTALGLVVATQTADGPAIYKGRSTNADSKPVASAGVRSVLRRLLPNLWSTAGLSVDAAQSDAARKVEDAFNAAISQGVAITDWRYEITLTESSNLYIQMEMFIAGQLEVFTAAVDLRSA